MIYLHFKLNFSIFTNILKENIMKKVFSIGILLFILASLSFQSCTPEDTQGPKVYVLDPAGDVLHGADKDTTLLLWSKYKDPGVFVEDNSTKSSDIIVTNDSANVFPANKEGYLRSTRGTLDEFAKLTYTAKDLAGNVGYNERPFRIANVSEAYIGAYTISRKAMHVKDTTYTSSITADSRVAGRLRFNKVYAHKWDNKSTYFKVNADLFSPELSPSVFDERYGYIGKKNDPSTAYYSNMTYTPAMNEIYNYTYLKIDAQHYEDSLNNKVYISGVADINDIPLSRIEFLGESRTITKIVLELNVTKNGQVDRVTETYIPR